MSIDKHQSLLFHKIQNFTLQTRVMDALCCVLVILGLFGNILGLFIFSSSRRTWRISSIYTYLATCSSITNLLCVIRYAFVLHSTSRNFLHDLVERRWWACKLYEFSFSFRIIASWITLFWMFERLICVSLRLRTFFTCCNSFKLKFIIPIVIIICILSCVVGPPVYMYQPQMSDEDLMNSTETYCELSATASIQWKKYFHEIHFGLNHFTIRCFFSELIPTGAVILFNFYIISHLIRTHRRLYQLRKEQSRTTSWMNVVLLLHALLFLLSLLLHIVGHFTVTEAHEAWWVLLAILINSSVNFYLYCLSGKAFRNEIRRFLQQIKIELLRKLRIRQDRCCLNQERNDEMDYSQVMIPLNRRHLNDFHKHLST